MSKLFDWHQNISEFSIFFHEIYTVAKSYQVLVADIKSLLISALVSLEARLKVPIFAIFHRFYGVFQAVHFDLGQRFFTKI